MQLGKHIAAGSAFISNFILWEEAGYFDSASETKALLHLWSLGIEEQFYIVWPALLWLSWKYKFNFLAITILISTISFFLCIYGVNFNPIATFYSPFSRFWELLSGSVLAYFNIVYRPSDCGNLLKVYYTRLSSKPFIVNSASFIGLVILVYGFFKLNGGIQYPGKFALIPVIGAVMIILAGPKAWVNRYILSNKIAIWFGLISYPLYLWHWPLLSFARIIEGEAPTLLTRYLMVILSIFLAYLTYTLIEKPIRKNVYTNKMSILLLLMMAFVGLAGIISYTQLGFPSRAVVIKNISGEQFINEDQVAQFNSNPISSCSNLQAHTQFNKWCKQYTSNNSKKTVLVWGDSSSGAWSPVFQLIAKENDYTLIVISHPSCPPILGVRKTEFGFPESKDYCADGKMTDEILKYIYSIKPDLVILIAAWNYYSPYSKREFITDDAYGDANWFTTEHALRNKVPKTLRKLSDISKLIVFKSWPILPLPPNYPIKRMDFLPSKTSALQIDREEFIKDSALINDVLLTSQYENVFFYDPSEKICKNTSCNLLLNGMKLYSDIYHITPQGSLQFKSDLTSLIR